MEQFNDQNPYMGSEEPDQVYDLASHNLASEIPTNEEFTSTEQVNQESGEENLIESQLVTLDDEANVTDESNDDHKEPDDKSSFCGY